ncbi:unnamed protein product [Blepharisma stoltei]|uniref:Uncharacterized protein n=1 Tax=Blepharisma stoltei TaxID=1481888 RepID=A0AAU9JFG9_9CILI|nr:unnamed protein product [Blepharisma stoltei]
MNLRNSVAESSKKSFIKHAKNLSQQSYMESEQIDIVSQFRNYRNQKSKSSISPAKIGSYSQSPGKSPGHEIFHYPFPPSSARPTSNSRQGALISAKSQDLHVMRPHGSAAYSTDRNINTVSRSHRYYNRQGKSEDFSIIKLNDASPTKSFIQEIEFSKLDEDEYRVFLESFSHLHALKFDLELNWEISNGKECIPPDKGNMGTYYILKDKIQNYKELGLKSMKNYKSEELIEILKEYSRICRDIFRGIKVKGNSNNEVMMLEMLWRLMLKLLDTLMRMHEESINAVVECTRARVRVLSDEHLKYTQQLQSDYERTIAKLTAEINSKTNTIKVLTKDKTELLGIVANRDQRIAELTEMDKQEASCIEMNRMLSKLNTYITEAESEQLKQVVTLNNISSIMTIAEILGKSPEILEKEIQTAWSIKDFAIFPEIDPPAISLHPFAKISFPQADIPASFNIPESHLLFQSVLDKGNGDNDFCFEVLYELIDRFSKSDEVSFNTVEIVKILSSQKDYKSRLFLKMMGIPHHTSIQCQTFVLKINQMFRIYQEDNHLLSLGHLYEFLNTNLNNCRHSCENILSRIEYICPESAASLPIDTSILILLCRLEVSIENSGKSLKSLSGNNDHMTNKEFTEWAKEKANFWATEQEILILFDYLAKDHMVSIEAIMKSIEDYNIINFSKEIKIQKEDLLLKFIYEWEILLEKLIEKHFTAQKLQSHPKFNELVNSLGRDVPDALIKHAFAEIICKVPVLEVLEKYEIVPHPFILSDSNSKKKMKKGKGKK